VLLVAVKHKVISNSCSSWPSSCWQTDMRRLYFAMSGRDSTGTAAV
jgi:hypothetical protein